MITNGIKFKNFRIHRKSLKIKKILESVLKTNNSILQSLKDNYEDSFDLRKLKKFQKFKNLRLIGMGGSSLGVKAIYSFLKDKIKKNFLFIDNLSLNLKNIRNQKFLNLHILSIQNFYYHQSQK